MSVEKNVMENGLTVYGKRKVVTRTISIRRDQKELLKNPKKARQEYIEEHDERNQALSDKAKAKTYNLFQYIFAAVLIGFSIMGVELYIIIVLVVLYLFLTGANIYYINKLQKEM